MRRCLIWVLTLALVSGLTTPAAGYQLFSTRVGGRPVTLRWGQFPVRYFARDRGVPGVSATQFQAAINRAFTAWQDVPTAAITFQFVGFTGAVPFADDGMSTLGFFNRPDLERVLGATDFLINSLTGELIESDIFFNENVPWSVAPSGEQGRFDLESVALHEIGHLLGLGHSAIGETELQPDGRRRVIAAETVLFPIAFAAGDISDRTLKADDIAGVSDLYPDGDFSDHTGSISGRVTKNGAGVFGAHIVAFSPETGRLVGGLTVNSTGDFRIAGLAPGVHIVRVEPLDDADIDSFFEEGATVDLDFRVTFFERFAIVPRGGSDAGLEIKVARK